MLTHNSRFHILRLKKSNVLSFKSITLKQAGYKLVEGIKLKIGKRIYKYHKSRDIQGIIKTLTIKRDQLGDIYIFFSCELPDIEVNRAMTGKSAGFDFGLKTFLTPSDDTAEIDAPFFFKQGVKGIKKANKALSSKKKGSNNRKKARLNLARVHERIANQRRDDHFKTANRLAEQYDHLFFEDLHIKAIQMMWGRCGDVKSLILDFIIFFVFKNIAVKNQVQKLVILIVFFLQANCVMFAVLKTMN
jgi:putative transposase